MYFNGGRFRKNKKNKPLERVTSVDFSSPYEGSIGRSPSRQVADRMYDSRVTPEERQLGSELFQDSEGNYIRRTRLSSPAEPEMYFNGGRFGDPIKRAMRKARRQSRRRDKSLLSEELNRRYEEVGASQMMEEMAGIYPSKEAEFNKWYEENLPQIKENAYKEELSRRRSRDGGRRSQNRYNEKVRSKVGTGGMLNMLSDYFQR
jgi:hypothetical protein